MDFLSDHEISRLERERSGGITSGEVVRLYEARGARLSASTFRKYVQLGLLPRSRRVGRKGKHRGSQGVYPVAAVRRINAIKKMMAEGLTLEDIKRSFVFFKNQIDLVDDGLTDVLDGFSQELSGRPFGDMRRTELFAQLNSLRERASELVREVANLGSAVTAHQPEEAIETTLGA